MEVLKGDGKENKPALATELYIPLISLPNPIRKMELTKDQKFWYKYFGEQLIATKKLMKPDLIHLHRLARNVDYYVQAELRINQLGYDGGLVQTFKRGATNVSGHVTIRQKMLSEIDKLSKHFGFSFLDREKIKSATPVDGKQTSLLEEFNKFKTAN